MLHVWVDDREGRDPRHPKFYTMKINSNIISTLRDNTRKRYSALGTARQRQKPGNTHILIFVKL